MLQDTSQCFVGPDRAATGGPTSLGGLPGRDGLVDSPMLANRLADPTGQ